MTTATDLVQLAISPESVYGVTDLAPVFSIIRYTGEGIAFAPTNTQSNEMTGSNRQLVDSIQTGGATSGNLNFEFAKEDWLDMLLSGGMCYDWLSDELRIGTVFKSFTIEKKIPVGAGLFEYHRFPGCLVDSFNFDIKPNAVITGAFNIQGKTPTHDSNALVGATYVSPDYKPVMRAPRIVDINIDGVPAISKCFDSLQMTLNNNNRAIECIGTLGTKEIVLGQVSATTQFSVLFNDSSLLELLLNQHATSISVMMQDDEVTPSTYEFTLERIKFTANPIVAGGSKQNLINNVTAQATMNPSDHNTMIIGRFLGNDPVTVAPTPAPTGTPAPTPAPTFGAGSTQPRYALGTDTAYQVGNVAALFGSMAPVPGSTNGSKVGGPFTVSPGVGLFGWVAVLQSAGAGGVTFTDALGTGGWSGAGLTGNNTGASPSLSVSSTTYVDSSGTYLLFRQDYSNSPFTGSIS